MGSGISTSRPANSNEKKKKVAKIPLNIALVAIIKIQSQYRKKLAQRRFEEIREIVMEERRLEELRREEEEEQNAVEESPMITSSMQGSTKNPSMNHRNRFMRKVLPADQLATLAEDNTFISMPTFDPTSVMSKYSPLDSEHVIIYPLVGFVVKSRSNITGKKIFLNICHHEAVMTMESTAVREINDSTAAVFSRDFSSSLLPTLSSVGRPSTATSNSLLLGGGAVVASTMIQIGDVILPSSEYEECFSYDEDLGMVPIDASIKQEIARQAIKFWNITHQEDISDTCTFPKMKRGYFGDILPLTLNLKNKSLAHLPAALKDSQWSSVKDTRNSDEGRLSFSSLNSSTKDNHERFVLPYATELRSWVDLSSIRTRKEIEGTAIPTAATAHALAVIEHATAPKLANHSVKFSSRKVTHGTVELVTPRIFVPQVPLFGPAYAAELMATLPTPDVPAVFPAVSSSRTAAGGGGIGFGDADVSSLIVPASPGAVSASGSAAGSGHFTPQRPPGAKQARSATTGPGMLTAAATSGTPESSNKSTHRTLTSAAATTASRNNRGPPGQLNLESFEEENDDEMSLSFVAQSTPQSNTSFQQMATPGRGGKEMSVHRGPKDISASRIGGSSESSVHRANKQDLSFHKTMSMSQQQQSGRFDSPSKTSPQSQHFSFANMGFSEPSEFPTTTPVFVVLSQGMLYVYNRDPTRGTYYPYVSNPAAAAAGQPRKINSVPSSSSLNTVRGAGSNNNNSVGTSKSVNKHEYRPLIEYARIMLTEDCITTSHFLTQTSTTFFLHFHAPLANKVSPEDTLAVLYSHFSDVVPGGNVTIQLRSFSELRTWKAHLRSHILAGTAARRRVIMDYIGNTMINKSPINRKLTPKFGEVQCLQYPDLPKVFVKIEHGLVQIYDEKIAGDTAGKNLLKAVQLMDKCVNVRTEPQKDNSTNIILTLDVAENSVFSHGGGVDADEMYEFVFHKAYAMDESDSRDYAEFLQRNIQLAQNRYRAYLLPLLEHKQQQSVSVVNDTCDITTVKLAVNTGDDMDSDDEDDDETEDALKKHTLLSIYYIAHPSPDEEVKRKAELSLAPPTGVTTSAGVVNNHVLNLALSASGSFGDSSRNNNVEDSAADANGKNSAPAAASTGHLLQSHEDDNKTAIEEIMNKLQRNIGEVPTFDIVLNNQMLYFFHDMRYHFALNLTRCGDKASFRRAKAVEKLEVSKLRAKLLKEQQKASVFYLDSSSEDSDDSAAAGAEEESSLHEENDDDDARSVMSINFNQSRGFGSLSRANSSASVTAPLLSPNVPSIAAAPPLQAKSKSSVGRNPRAARPVKTIDAAAPPVSISERGGGVASGKSALLKSKGGRVLPESKAPPNYPITSWAIQLVSFDNRVYTLKFKTAAEYHEWREMLFFVGNESSDPLFPLSSTSTAATSANQTRSNSVSVPNFTLSKEDSFSHPETTISASNLPGMVAASVSAVGKNDVKYVDVEATKKFARLLRKDEKVLTSGQVLKHDSVSVHRTVSANASAAPKPRRILVLTDALRLLFLDPVGNIVRGNLELSNEGPVEVKMASITDFDVIISNTVNKFTSTELPDKNAVFWTTKIKQALTMR